MTTKTNGEAVFRQALLTSPGERQAVEYKSAIDFNAENAFGLKLIRHILGMANTGGGWIVIGYDDTTLQPDPNHSLEIAGTYDTTRLTEAVNKYIQRGQSIRLSVFKETHHKTQLVHPIIQIEEFQRIPFICRSTKIASDTNELILQSDKVYIRRPGAATSEIRTMSDWDDLLKKCVSQRRDEFLQEFVNLYRRMNSGVTIPYEDSKTRLNRWKGEQAKTSGIHELIADGSGYIESAYMLVRQQGFEWSLQDLRRAATSEKWIWPNEVTPKQSGIEVRIEQIGSFLLPEYWYLDKRGSCFSSRLLQEDHEFPGFSSKGHPKKMLWADLAVYRIGLELFRSAALYRVLDVPPDEPYLFSIEHGGIKGRAIYAYSASTPFTAHPYPAMSTEYSKLWRREVTQDLVRSQLVELTHEIASSLFELFGFTQVSKGLVANLLKCSRTNRGQHLVPEGS